MIVIFPGSMEGSTRVLNPKTGTISPKLKTLNPVDPNLGPRHQISAGGFGFSSAGWFQLDRRDAYMHAYKTCGDCPKLLSIRGPIFRFLL